MDFFIPERFAEQLDTLVHRDREVEGAFVFGDEGRYPDEEDIYVADVVYTEVGDTSNIEFDPDPDATRKNRNEQALREARQEEDLDFRYFHTHPLGALEESDNPSFSEFSDADYEVIEYMQDELGDQDYFELIFWPSESSMGEAGVKASREDVNIQVADWVEDDGTSWSEVNEEVRETLLRYGVERVDPFAETHYADENLFLQYHESRL